MPFFVQVFIPYVALQNEVLGLSSFTSSVSCGTCLSCLFLWCFYNTVSDTREEVRGVQRNLI